VPLDARGHLGASSSNVMIRVFNIGITCGWCRSPSDGAAAFAAAAGRRARWRAAAACALWLAAVDGGAGPAGPPALLRSGGAGGASPFDAAGVLRFGLTADYPPFAARTADGRLIGADVEAARRVARALGREAHFVPTTWASLAADFAAGRFDVLVGGITVTPERAALGRYSITLLEDGKRPLVRCDDRERLATPAQLDRPQVRVMINRGPGMPAVAQRLFPRARLVVNREDATLVPFLLEGRVDAWVTDGVVVDHMARRHAGVLCAARSGPWPATEVRKAWLVRADPGLADAIDVALRDELASGRWRRDLEAVP
jgi:cyclohexadienyl dehydratase